MHVQVLSQSEHWARTQTNFADVKVGTMRTLLKYYMAWIKCVAVAIMKNRNRGDINVNGVFAINYQIMLLVTMDNLLKSLHHSTSDVSTSDDGQPSKSLHHSL